MKPLHFNKALLTLAASFALTAATRAQEMPAPAAAPCPQIINLDKTHLSAEVTASVKEALQLASRETRNALQLVKAGQALEFLENLEPNVIIVNGPDDEEQPQPNAYDFTKSKKFSKTFKVSSADKLAIENQFGKVDVQTWSRNEISVEVNITTRASTDGKAQEILDKINIQATEGANQVSVVTVREPMHIQTASGKSFEVNYLIKMPKSNPVSISNKFGDVVLPDLDGTSEVSVKYGNINAGRLNSKNNRVSLEYGKELSTVEYMRGGNLNVKYSAFKLGSSESLMTTTAYSSIAIDNIDALAVESRYDRAFKVGNVNQLSGRGAYTTFTITNLKESAGMDMKYCSKFEITNIASGFKKIDVTGGYTTISLNFADKTAFNFDVNTSYGNLKVDQDLVDYSFKEVRNTSATYKGKFGKASPKGLVNVTSKYGSVQFN
ncbi:hypothetical protein GU926_15620 [Nibribacter ruber]|uniref:DUF4097 family beta strand repeat protein n=1 Tax=Nibribacter ruber TaxID=2698458 RepID=A0A6P1P2Z2_9BACT|nr:hypothetical protein [Nibribacter ruber]QHL88777.1 hypothetical protein GU926_15620 [Nibribacter ruber]